MANSDFSYCKITNDVAFKSVFISPDDGYRSLITLLNNTLRLSIEQIESLTVIDPYNYPGYLGDKLTVLDVKVLDSSSEKYNIEIQLCGHLGFDRRILYYWSKLFCQDLKEKEPYSHLKKTHSLIILDYTYFSQYPNDYFFEFEVLEKTKHFAFSDALHICVIELSKVQDSMPLNDADAWALFLKNPNNPYKEKMMESFPEIKNTYSKLGSFSSDPIKRDEYEAREKIIRDNFAIRLEDREEGRLEGLSEGRLEGLSKGRLEGLSEGRLEGLSEGEWRGKATIIQTLLLTQTREQVSKMLNISTQEIDQIITSAKK